MLISLLIFILMYHIATHNIGFDYFMVIINKTVGILTQQSITGKWLAISKNLISLMELLKGDDDF